MVGADLYPHHGSLRLPTHPVEVGALRAERLATCSQAHVFALDVEEENKALELDVDQKLDTVVEIMERYLNTVGKATFERVFPL